MNKLIKIFLITILLLSASNIVLAQSDGSVSGKVSDGSVSGKPDPNKTTPVQQLVKLQNPLKVDSVEEVIYLGIDILIYIGILYAVFAIIFTGFKFVLAQGNPKEIEDAKKKFTYIIIGLAVLISSKVIVTIVQNTLKQAGVVKEGILNSPIK